MTSHVPRCAVYAVSRGKKTRRVRMNWLHDRRQWVSETGIITDIMACSSEPIQLFLLIHLHDGMLRCSSSKFKPGFAWSVSFLTSNY